MQRVQVVTGLEWEVVVKQVAGGCLTQPPGEEMVEWPPEKVACPDAPEVLHAKRAGRLVRPGPVLLRDGSGRQGRRCKRWWLVRSFSVSGVGPGFSLPDLLKNASSSTFDRSPTALLTVGWW